MSIITHTLSNLAVSFKTISCPAGTDPVADELDDTLTLTSADAKLTITGDEATDTIEFAVIEAQINTDHLENIVEDVTPQLGGDLDLNGNNLDFPTTPNISDCLDEDNMVSDSATMLATQQSIKAYADNSIAASIAAHDLDAAFDLGNEIDGATSKDTALAVGDATNKGKAWTEATGFYSGTGLLDFRGDANGASPAGLDDQASDGDFQVVASFQDHNKVLEMITTGAEFCFFISTFSEGLTDGYVEIWLATDGSAGYNAVYFTESEDYFHGFAVWIRGENIYRWVGSTETLIQAAPADTWVHIRIYVDVPNSLWHMWINGIPVSDSGWAWDGVIVQFEEIMLYAFGEMSGAYVDAIGYSWEDDYIISQNTLVKSIGWFNSIVTEHIEVPGVAFSELKDFSRNNWRYNYNAPQYHSVYDILKNMMPYYSENAEEINCALEGGSDNTAFVVLDGSVQNTGGVDFSLEYIVTKPLYIHTLSLHFANARLGLADADATNKVIDFYIYGCVGTITVDEFYHSPADKQNATEHLYSFVGAHIDCDGYDKIFIKIKCEVADPNALKVKYVILDMYYS